MTRREIDGYMMLIVSITLILLSFCISFLLVFTYILYVAITSHCNSIKNNDVIVLGKQLVNNEPDMDYRLRLNRVITLLKHQANKKIYLLGGVTAGTKLSESLAARHYLEKNNVDISNTILEERSIDTLDNIKQLKNKNLLTRNAATLITNRYHLARASIMAGGFGFVIERCAAEDNFDIKSISKLIHESFFLHWYLSGKLFAKLTNNKRLLARIQ